MLKKHLSQLVAVATVATGAVLVAGCSEDGFVDSPPQHGDYEPAPGTEDKEDTTKKEESKKEEKKDDK